MSYIINCHKCDSTIFEDSADTVDKFLEICKEIRQIVLPDFVSICEITVEKDGANFYVATASHENGSYGKKSKGFCSGYGKTGTDALIALKSIIENELCLEDQKYIIGCWDNVDDRFVYVAFSILKKGYVRWTLFRDEALKMTKKEKEMMTDSGILSLVNANRYKPTLEWASWVLPGCGCSYCRRSIVKEKKNALHN